MVIVIYVSLPYPLVSIMPLVATLSRECFQAHEAQLHIPFPTEQPLDPRFPPQHGIHQSLLPKSYLRRP